MPNCRIGARRLPSVPNVDNRVVIQILAAVAESRDCRTGSCDRIFARVAEYPASVRTIRAWRRILTIMPGAASLTVFPLKRLTPLA